MKLIVITGTPGSGKTTIAKEVASKIKDSELVHANDLIKSKHIFSSYSKDGAMVVKLDMLAREIDRLRKSSGKRILIIEGHVLCDMKIKGATAVVIREHLETMRNRLEERGYAKKKINDNLVSEAIDYCGANASMNYKESFELMNSKDAASTIVSIIEGKMMPRKQIDLLHELVMLMKKEKVGFI